MAKVVDDYTVETKGKGAPDYSSTVSSARERAGIYLQYPQRLKMYGRSLNLGGDAEYPWVASTPLAAGANTHLTDFETLGPMPVTVPKGYTMTMVTIGHTLSQDAQIYSYINGGIFLQCLAAVSGGQTMYENKVIGLSSSWIDPAGHPGASAHVFDIKLYNIGLADLFGSVVVDCILEAVGTGPLPTTKECHCPYCANKQVESVHATIIKCTNCGREYVVFDLTGIRRTP